MGLAAKFRSKVISNGASRVMNQIRTKLCMIAGPGLTEASMEGSFCKDPSVAEGANTGHEDQRADNCAWLPGSDEESRLGSTISINGLLGALQEGVIT